MKTAKEKLDINAQLIEKYERGLGIPEIKAPGEDSELQEYLNMERDVIEKLSPNRTWSISVRLSQFSFYLQRCINRNKAVVKFADYELNKLVAQEVGQYDKWTKHEVKVSLICKENVAAAELLQIKNYAEQIVERLTDLSAGIKSLSFVFSMGYKHKIGDRNE